MTSIPRSEYAGKVMAEVPESVGITDAETPFPPVKLLITSSGKVYCVSPLNTEPCYMLLDDASSKKAVDYLRAQHGYTQTECRAERDPYRIFIMKKRRRRKK